MPHLMTYGRCSVVVLLLAASAAPLGAALPEGAKHPPGYQWQYEPESHLALTGKHGVLWQLNFKQEDGKPYFHPLSTVDGALLTWNRPADHVWHWALWFSWKYINRLNYWEYDPKVGRPQGVTELVGVEPPRLDEQGACVVLKLSYHPPDKPAVLKERRTLTVSVPDAAGNYRIDWRQVFTAAQGDVVLDRTPPKEQSWGGYAGLSYRAAQALTDAQMTDSQGRHDLAFKGQRADWVDLSGRFGAPQPAEAGVTIFDHAANPRHRTPWHCVQDFKPGHPFGYINPALLYEEPLTIPAGKSLALFYRVLVHAGRCNPEELDREFRAFCGVKPE